MRTISTHRTTVMSGMSRPVRNDFFRTLIHPLSIASISPTGQRPSSRPRATQSPTCNGALRGRVLSAIELLASLGVVFMLRFLPRAYRLALVLPERSDFGGAHALPRLGAASRRDREGGTRRWP